MLANDGVDFAFDRGAPVSVHLPCEALRVLRAEAAANGEQESGISATPVRSAAD